MISFFLPGGWYQSESKEKASGGKQQLSIIYQWFTLILSFSPGGGTRVKARRKKEVVEMTLSNKYQDITEITAFSSGVKARAKGESTEWKQKTLYSLIYNKLTKSCFLFGGESKEKERWYQGGSKRKQAAGNSSYLLFINGLHWFFLSPRGVGARRKQGESKRSNHVVIC